MCRLQAHSFAAARRPIEIGQVRSQTRLRLRLVAKPLFLLD
jgi:hypothetical protein